MFKSALTILTVWTFSGMPMASATTDMFECTSKVTDLNNNESVESTAVVAGYRLVTPNTPEGKPYPAGIEVTRGEAKTSIGFSRNDMNYKADLTLKYGFARRPIGNSNEARQFVCGQVAWMGCKNKACVGTTDVCLSLDDPFDGKYGWSHTILSKNVPVFNEQLLRPIDFVTPVGPNESDRTRVTINCILKGTYL
jgi:hypothetical protein